MTWIKEFSTMLMSFAEDYPLIAGILLGIVCLVFVVLVIGQLYNIRSFNRNKKIFNDSLIKQYENILYRSNLNGGIKPGRKKQRQKKAQS